MCVVPCDEAMGSFALAKADAPTLLDGDDARSAARLLAPQASSQQSIIPVAMVQAVGPGGPASVPERSQIVEETILQVADEVIGWAARAAYREVCADVAAELLAAKQAARMEATSDETPEVDGEVVQRMAVEGEMDCEDRIDDDALASPPLKRAHSAVGNGRRKRAKQEIADDALRQDTAAHGRATKTKEKMVYINRPRGRGPVGKEWDTSIGDWVAMGKSKGEAWEAWRAPGGRKPFATRTASEPVGLLPNLPAGKSRTSSNEGRGVDEVSSPAAEEEGVEDADDACDDEEVENDLEEKEAACRDAISALARYVVSCGGSESMVRGWRAVRSRRSNGSQTDISYRRPSGAGGGVGKEQRFRSRVEIVRFLGLQPGPPADHRQHSAPLSRAQHKASSTSSKRDTTTSNASDSCIALDAENHRGGGWQPSVQQLDRARATAAPILPSEEALARAAEIGRKAAMAMYGLRH